MTQVERIGLADATDLICRALTTAGVPSGPATSVAEALVAAEAEGQVGHGFSRLGDYVAQVRSGKINARAQISVQTLRAASLRVDADCGFAYPAMDAAIAAGIPVALEQGIAVMGVANSHHCGALSVQVEKLARAGLIGLMFANAPKAIAPWGSHVPVFGTNPIAFAVPRAQTAPLVIDLSLSKVARGKVMNAYKSGQPIPEGWALDAAGQPTTDAKAALDGTMRPIGDAKGTSLALMVEILAALLTGSALSTEATSFFDAEGAPPRVGQTLIAIRPEDGAAGGFADRLEGLLGLIAGLEGARLPGTRRLAAIAEARDHGLSVPRHYLDLARSLCNAD
ncbi:Ldh family oxidoreductase [Sulfitobacter sabulilitoris]|uniref:Ldh family oxidoreductase n=1 Tax=Sulfitobacter sabulilitoris TaxID=2562655 RepID=A0A5S3PIV9_9RHOB|nr:Ldh family oxidoreductase [Sulfitobacter sabulilitoris]TMM54216.1 Ldh family oxidoreductase [Sulfitobacter sabulilitoris]